MANVEESYHLLQIHKSFVLFIDHDLSTNPNSRKLVHLFWFANPFLILLANKVYTKEFKNLSNMSIWYLESVSLRGRRSKGKGKGIRARDHARGRREEGNACKEAIVFVIPPTN